MRFVEEDLAHTFFVKCRRIDIIFILIRSLEVQSLISLIFTNSQRNFIYLFIFIPSLMKERVIIQLFSR